MRREQFQIKTQICVEDGVRFVEKSAVRKDGVPHIRRFADSYARMEQFYENVSLLKPSFEGDVMRYDYVEAPTLDEILVQRIAQGEDTLTVLRQALDRLLAVKADGLVEFAKTDEFTAVFGPAKRAEGQALVVSNIDMLFENIMVKGDRWICLDYEWVFDFPIPVDFVRYRILLYFYRHHEALFEGKMDATGLMERMGISRPMAIQFSKMEKAFQEYVHGENNCYTYMNRYAKKAMDFDKTIYDYNVQIQSLHTAVQLKENHIQNLNGLIAGQQEVINKYSKIKNVAKKFVPSLCTRRRRLCIRLVKNCCLLRPQTVLARRLAGMLHRQEVLTLPSPAVVH